MDLSFLDLRCPIPILFLIVLLPKWPPSKRQRAVSLGWGVGTVTTNGLPILRPGQSQSIHS